MAVIWYRTDSRLQQIADALNDLKKQLGGPGTNFHLDAYESPVASPAATDLPSVLSLVNETRAVFEAHKADALAHKAKGSPGNSSRAIDLPTAITLANTLKAGFNTHIGAAAAHYTVDQANAVVANDATDLASLVALANALKGALNAHLASAPAAKSIRVLDP
jgi:hypothetical protein